MQLLWKYHDVSGYLYHIGLYHNAESGNFLLYINEATSIIDFKVFESKSYSVYLGNELFRISITKRENGDFTYDLDNISPHWQGSVWERTRDRIILYILVFIGLVIFFVLLRWITS